MRATTLWHEYMPDMVFQDEYCRSPLSHSVHCISNDRNLFFVLYLLLLVHMTDDLYYTFQDILNLQYITVKYTLHLFNCMISEYKRHAENVT